MKNELDKAVLISLVVGFLCVGSVGYFLTTTMIDELEDHPEITEIGPPDFTNVGPVAAFVLIVAFIIGVILLFKKPDTEIKVKGN